MSKNTTPAATAPGTDTSKAGQPCVGCADKAGTCADCAPTAQTEAQAIPTPSAGGRYVRAEDGTLTPAKE